MPAERAGYTVTMFIIDVSRTMGHTRTVDLPNGRTTEMTNLEWAIQFVKFKIQDMIYSGRKTDKCGVILFGTEETENILSEKGGGYEHVQEYIPITQPSSRTLAKLDTLSPSDIFGDPIDGIIVAAETQQEHLAKKKSWTRKMVLVTDGENPIEVEDWEATVDRMNVYEIQFTIIGVDFDSDDDDFPFKEEGKSHIKSTNEEFFRDFIARCEDGRMGTCAHALHEIARPDMKPSNSVLMGTVLRIGDVETRAEEAIDLPVKTSKCTAVARPKSWKKFAIQEKRNEKGEIIEDETEFDEDGKKKPKKLSYVQLKMRTEYALPLEKNDDDEETKTEETEDVYGGPKHGALVEKEDLVRGFKYGTSYAPCPDGQFPRLSTKKGMDICGFFPIQNFRREYSMSEIQYVWADPQSTQSQVALSSIVLAMKEHNLMAIARWVTKDGADPKMGVLYPELFEKVECLLWAQVPFADDVRKYTFASLENLLSKKGEALTEHPYLPTEEQQDAMDAFVDSMDLMQAGDVINEKGDRGSWFDTIESYNPAIHRVKQAMFHCAVVHDIETNPLPPPHEELLRFFEPPPRALKKSRKPLEKCISTFKIKEVPKKTVETKKDAYQHANDDDDEMLLLDRRPQNLGHTKSQSQVKLTELTLQKSKNKAPTDEDSDTEESENDDDILLDNAPAKSNSNGPQPPLPTPARSISPDEDVDMDLGPEPGRIIGSTFPLKDFKKNVKDGDTVSKAIQDLALVITEIITRPFGSRRTAECIECMQAMRQTALDEDEADAWNGFLKDLKGTCLSLKPGNKEFWEVVQQVGRTLSLISTEEAEKNGYSSTISEVTANTFLNV